jgi:thiol-disulfide isomerase/thioredoxin
MKFPTIRLIFVFIAGFAACFLIIIVAVVGAYYFWLQPQMDKMSKISLKAPPLPSMDRADFNLKFKDLNNKEHSLKDLIGKTVVLNFWATWCVPCVAELPSLTRLSAKYRNNPNIAVICLSDESLSTIRSKEYIEGVKSPIFSSEGHKIPSMFKKSAIPATFIISADGCIVFSHIGSANWDDSSVITFIDSLTQKTEQSAAPN